MTRFATTVLAALLCAGTVSAEEPTGFGFPAGFSATKMDRRADPRRDFTRYAAGTWYDAMTIPADSVRMSGLDLMVKRTDKLLHQVVETAAQAAATAPKGSPTQQIGALYAAGMDETRLKALGNTPLQPVFQRIAAVSDKRQLIDEIIRLSIQTDNIYLLGLGISPGIRDKSAYIIMVGDEELVLPNFEDYLKPEAAPYRAAYLTYVTDLMVLAGFSRQMAADFAPKLLALETRIARVRQPLVEHQDPDKRFVEMPYAQLKALTPAFDWDTYLAAAGLPTPSVVTAIEVKAIAERNAILQELPLADLKTYLAWNYLRHSLGGLSADFTQPGLALSRAYLGQSYELPPRGKQVFDMLAVKIGHPLSRLYVDSHFSADARKDVETMIGHVRDEFRSRLERNTWLTAETRKQALTKLDKVSIKVGYPDTWIDFSPVDVRADDFFGSLERITEFQARRDLARFGGPIQEDDFADHRATLPIVINAAYNPLRNSIEIPAAFLQQPIYDAKADPAVNFCAIGAVIGHELTHGFDSGGRLYDEDGRARNWWNKQDETQFIQQAQKLVQQANAYAVLPGLHANGALAVTENLADVGGIAFAYGALEKYLKAHPEKNRRIDGLTPQQRCFVAWAQMWSDKSREGYLRQVTATDAHPPGGYRAYAPAQHEAGFYKAFKIRPGDPMWLAPEKRVHIW